MEIIQSDPLRFLAGIFVYSLVITFFISIIIIPAFIVISIILEKFTRVGLDNDKWKKVFTYKLFLSLVIISSVFLSYTNIEKSLIRKQEREQKKQECIDSPNCQDDIARMKSLISDRPVTSTTGNYFFNGRLCHNQCIELFSGYNWAKDRGVTKELGCEDLQEEQFVGCLMYVEEESYLYD